MAKVRVSHQLFCEMIYKEIKVRCTAIAGVVSGGLIDLDVSAMLWVLLCYRKFWVSLYFRQLLWSHALLFRTRLDLLQIYGYK